MTQISISLSLGANLRSGGANPLATYFTANGFKPKLAADFAGESGSEGYMVDGESSTFDAMFPGYARSGNATMGDSDGVPKWAPHHLLPGSETLETWNNTGGTLSGSVLTENTADGQHILVTSSTISPRATLVVEFKTSRDWVRLSFYDGRGRAAYFQLSTETAGTVADAAISDATISAIGGGIYRVTATVTNQVAHGSGIQIGPTSGDNTSSYVGSGVDTFEVIRVWQYRSDLGGMVNNPDTGDSYVPTTSAARYLPRRNNHVWDGSAWVNAGLLVESESRAQLLHGTSALPTQTEEVTAAPYTLTFRGTGSVTLSGAHSATLTGTGVNDLARLTFTPTAGTLTVTPSGTVDYPQLEQGSTPSSFIPNTAASGSVTRAADVLPIPAANLPYSATGVSGAMRARITYADTGAAAEQTLFDWRADADNRITLTLDTSGANTGTLTLTVVDGGTSTSVSATAELTPGVDVAAGVAWRVTASEINIALDGTAETAVSNAAGVPDVSAVSVSLGEMASFGSVVGWDADVSDTGIEEASA